MNNKEKIVEMRKILVDDMGEDVAKERIFDKNKDTDLKMMVELTNCKKGYQAERIFNDYSKTIIGALWDRPYKILSRIWFKQENIRFKDFEITTQIKRGVSIQDIHDEVDIKYQCRQNKLQLNRGYFDDVINYVENNHTLDVGNKHIIFFMFDKSNTGKVKVVRKSWWEIKQSADKLTSKGLNYVQLDYEPEDVLTLDIENFYLDEVIEWEQKFVYQDEVKVKKEQQLSLSEYKEPESVKVKPSLSKKAHLCAKIDPYIHTAFKEHCAKGGVKIKFLIAELIKKELCIP
tara:strand:+ start:114 stop:980 length:867 start_codon:yes stop_codon:yes gene_type:complete